MARILGFAALVAVLAQGLVAARAWSGEVAGRVVVPVPVIQANLGAPPLLPGMEPDRPPVATGPVLVYVAEAAGSLPRTATAGVRVRLAGGKLNPPLVAVSLGSAIEFENADRREHRMVSRSGPLHLDLGWQARGMTRELRASQTGSIQVECALHGDMRGEIVVLAHAAFVLADAAGGYRLPDLPPGRATIVAYAPRLGEVSREVEVPESGAVEVQLAF
jgi:plastocyanin